MAEPATLSSSAIPLGFRFAATRAGIKPSGNLDLACIVAAEPATAAAMFTNNQVVAAPVRIGREHMAKSHAELRMVLVNAGNANCATGKGGLAACRQVCEAAAQAFGVRPEEVFPSSTGIIGVPLPAEKITAALPSMMDMLSTDAKHFEDYATAIMTTDTRMKVAHASIAIQGREVRLLGTTKGAGMIQPRLVSEREAHATMLAYLMTDARVDVRDLNEMLQVAVEQSFNRVSIDGDTSTNDTVLILASGASGASIQTTEDRNAFQSLLFDVCTSLAKQIVSDGEGARHRIELRISGARSDDDALAVARSIANSPLVKTAWAGSDPNWGRLLAAAGNAGVHLDSERISVHFGEYEVCKEGRVATAFDEVIAHGYLQQPEFTVSVDLGAGDGECTFWTCDLTADYVHINADYST